jgi:hypothetical protein
MPMTLEELKKYLKEAVDHGFYYEVPADTAAEILRILTELETRATLYTLEPNGDNFGNDNED